MAHIIGSGRYSRETYPETRGFGSLGPTGPEGPSVFATGARPNKHMSAETTVADGNLACLVPIAVSPAASSTNGGYIAVDVNGVDYHVGDGTKVGVVCYFSNDGGATARLLQDVVAGDLLYWNGSVAGFELSALTDKLNFNYEVAA